MSASRVIAGALLLTAPAFDAGSARGAACGREGATATIRLAYDPSRVSGVRAAKVDLGYPSSGVTIPGDRVDAIGAVENLFDPDGSRGSTVVVNDHDSNADGKEDSLTVVYLSPRQDIAPAPEKLLSVRLACAAGMTLVASDVPCRVVDATDSIGNSIRGVSCEAAIEAR